MLSKPRTSGPRLKAQAPRTAPTASRSSSAQTATTKPKEISQNQRTSPLPQKKSVSFSSSVKTEASPKSQYFRNPTHSQDELKISHVTVATSQVSPSIAHRAPVLDALKRHIPVSNEHFELQKIFDESAQSTASGFFKTTKTNSTRPESTETMGKIQRVPSPSDIVGTEEPKPILPPIQSSSILGSALLALFSLFLFDTDDDR